MFSPAAAATAALAAVAAALGPAPVETRFADGGRVMVVVGSVREPHDEDIPRRILVDRGGRPRDHGWVWKKTFREHGVPVLNVCEDKDGKPWLYPPWTVWAASSTGSGRPGPTP